jgi:hypothetical protein
MEVGSVINPAKGFETVASNCVPSDNCESGSWLNWTPLGSATPA